MYGPSWVVHERASVHLYVSNRRSGDFPRVLENAEDFLPAKAEYAGAVFRRSAVQIECYNLPIRAIRRANTHQGVETSTSQYKRCKNKADET